MPINSIKSYDTYNLLKDGLKASNARSKAIANNMANINTKGYKKFNVIFEENLKNNSDKKDLSLKTTNSRHLRGNNDLNGDNGDIEVVREENTSMRTDDNNVNLELEKVNQAANTLKYNALITKLNGKFNNLKTVIK
ncbi:flagellar basal body rod protein FlgB [Clostridium sp. VAP51]|uniref:flagellar basal body rod protein FlgB n=1 Tax=Clostridium sp. VAP51 TaxID=2949978 RepID=UPI00207A088B|nr:flagellar basal body rod protein FlgB [Clostridium sp. VAP51]